MKSGYKKKLSRKTIFFCTIFTIALSTFIGGLGYLQYKSSIEDSYMNYAEALISIIRSNINPEKLQSSIKAGVPDEDYQNMQNMLNRVKENSDAQYIYIIYYPDGWQADTIAYGANGYTSQELETEPETIRKLGDLVGVNVFSDDMRTDFRESIEYKETHVRFYDNVTKVNSDEMAQKEYVKTAYLPIWQEDNSLVGVLCLDISMTDIYQKLSYYRFSIVVGSTLMAALFLVIFITVTNFQVIKPIRRIATSAEDFVKQRQQVSDPSEFHFNQIEVHTGDEIELLSDSLNNMVNEMIHYMIEMKQMSGEKERMGAERNVAKQIQRNLYPCVFPAFPERKEFDIYAKLQSAASGGGDFYNFFFTDSTHLCVLLGNVSGMGIPTTMLAAISTTLMKNYTELGYAPGRILFETNNQISINNKAELNIISFLGILNLTTGKMDYVNAGDLIPLVKKPGQGFEVLENKKSIQLGAMENVPFFQQSVYLAQGELLFLYSRGMAETEDARGNMYTDACVCERLDEITKREARLSEMIEFLFEDMERFKDGVDWKKDCTMLILRYYGE